jgi:CRP-like cAMP-binding protein
MDTQTLLKNIYLFKDAGHDDLADLSRLAVSRKYLQGEFVFNEGDQADAMFVVEMGTVDIVPAGKDLAVLTIGSGQTFGEMSHLCRGERPASARARETSSVLRIPFDRLERLLAERPTFAIAFYRNASGFLAKHLRTLLSELDHRYF